MERKDEKQVRVAQAELRPVQVNRLQRQSDAAEAEKAQEYAAMTQAGNDPTSFDAQGAAAAAPENDAWLRAEFAETLRLERERAAAEKQETLDILHRERAEAAAAIALTRAGARNLKAARALLTVDPAGFDGTEQALAFADGLQTQIDALKAGEETGFLFAASAPALCGFVPAEGRDEAMEDIAAPISLSDAVRRALSSGV